MRLTTHLLYRITLSASVFLLLVLAGLTWSGHRTAVQELEAVAASMERILEMQFVGLTQSAGLTPRFPDWDPVVQVPRPQGSCVRLFDANDVLLRSSCRGQARDASSAPAWFNTLYSRLFRPGRSLARSVEGGALPARLELAPAAEVEIMRAWLEIRSLALPAALLIGALSVTVWWSVRRAVLPAVAIADGLAAIERGRLDTRLGPFPWTEFDQIATACNALAASLAASQAARTTLSRRLVRVQEEERHALARDLHDEFGQHLTAVNANAAALRSSLTQANAIAEARRIEFSAQHLMALVRGMLQQLRPWTAGDSDLSASLRALAVRDADIRFTFDGDIDNLPAALAGAVYRIVQEALTNALRHARASSIRVTVERCGDALAIAVSDDGRGLDGATDKAGFGIAGINERAAAFLGTAAYHRNDHGGLTVEVRFPQVSTAGTAT